MVDFPPPGRSLPDPAFAGDDGTVDPELASALSDLAAGTGSGTRLIALLASARLLVPVVAVLEVGETGPEGRHRDKQSSMASVTVRAADGTRSLVAFTCTASLRAWRREARPIPADGRRVAQAALAEGADALVIDPAGPVPFAVADAELRALALAADPAAPPHADLAVASAVADICAGELAVVSATLQGAEPTGVRVVLVVDDAVPIEEFRALVLRLQQALAGSMALRALVGELQVAVVPPTDAPAASAGPTAYRRV